ncbi:MAG: hypothetical protein AAF456_21395 [Planctomycetota bacterium]
MRPPTREYWIQIEGRDDRGWEMVPNAIDRMHGGYHTRYVERVLKYRRYKPPERGGRGPWEEPDDRKVNPWDLNELNPSMTDGSIPGPTLECSVGESGVGEDIVIHFRNDDQRTLPFSHRCHSMHPHGILFPTKYDGSYPLSPPDDPSSAAGSDEFDPDNRIENDADIRALWHRAGTMGAYKQGDRVPPGGTFTYRWRTHGNRNTAGVWLYHDHSIHDADNVRMGAIGFLVIHDGEDEEDIFIDYDTDPETFAAYLPDSSPAGDAAYLDERDPNVKRLRKPPEAAQYLQLYHELATPIVRDGNVSLQSVGMAINGRTFLGSAPTLIAGAETKMRFGVGAMNENTFHTFHIHGHRWILKRHGEYVSQLEDTRILGPAESFHFTIQQGSSLGPPTHGNGVLGEWHMHCHVLGHMMPGGMMGSLLVIDDTNPRLGDVLQSGMSHSH